MASLKQFIWCGLLASVIQIFTLYISVSSSTNIENFLQKEAEMIIKIQDNLVQERERLDKLRMYQQEWKEWRNSNTNQESEYIKIPQNLFHLFKRVTRDLDELESIMTENKQNVTDDTEPLTEDQLRRAILSLVDLQYQYDLKPEDIMNGTLLDLRLNESLSLESNFLIAKTCWEYNNHRCVVDWLETCLSRNISSDQEFAIRVYNLTYRSYEFLNEYEKAFEHAVQFLQYDFFDAPTFDTYMDLGLLLGKLDDDDNATLEANRLCREHQHTNPNQANLKCRYNHENSAFLKIAPLKEEELYHYPKVLLYRDIIYDSEIEIIKDEAMKTLGVARLAGGVQTSISKDFTYRISESGFIDNKLPVLSQLAKRVEDISDLSMNSSEWWQVLNYAPGGFYMMHSDYLNENHPDVIRLGNRITSMLFYFNEIVQGGETVFPRIGVSVKPAKGLALVWHNVHGNGSKNLLTDHCACPVVIGEKWGFTQWMRSFNQTCLRKIYEYEPVTLYETENNSTQFQTLEGNQD